MTTLIEAAKQALEALDCIYSPLHVREIDKVAKAMSVLRQAIEEAEKQEPVGYFSVNDYGNWEQNESGHGEPFYTTPPAAQPAPVQEPVTWGVHDQQKLSDMLTAQRQWVGLTDEEFEACFEEADGTLASLMYAIEAKLKEKNHD